MERFLLSQRTLTFEMWQVVLAALFFFLGLIGYGALVDRGARVQNADILSKSANTFARIPATSKDVIFELMRGKEGEIAWQQRFQDESGFRFHADHQSTGDLLLLARYDGDRRRSVVDIVDLNTGESLHQYVADNSKIKKVVRNQHEVAGDRRDDVIDASVAFRPDEYSLNHPFVEADGSIVYKDFNTPIIKMDACSNLDWSLYGAFHHALERDAEGHYWTVLKKVPVVHPHAYSGFEEDTLVRFSSDGDILYEKPLTEIFLENDLGVLVYPHKPYNADPYHLNDIQPALKDGPHWQKGDLFLSVRNQSTIFLYRPSTNEIVWQKRGPWMAQHDVDIISENEIAVFSNNAGGGKPNTHEPPGPNRFVVGTNETMVYNFDTNEVTSPYKSGYVEHDIRTPIEGLHEVLSNGDVWVDETRYGRIVVMDKAGNLKWSYVNRASNGTVFRTHWSRYVEGEEAQVLRERVARGFECD